MSNTNRVQHLIHTPPSGVSANPVDTLREIENTLTGVLRQFGFTDEESFPPLLATVGFVNAVVLARVNPDAASKLDAMLRAPVPVEAVAKVREILDPQMHSAPDFPSPLQRLFVSLSQSQSKDWPMFGVALRLGLTCLEHAPQLGLATLNLPHEMPEEKQFLSGRLAGWAPLDFRRPSSSMFHEFLDWRCARKPIERAVLVAEADEAIGRWPEGKPALHTPTWAGEGRKRGQAFMKHRWEIAPALFAEVSPDILASLRSSAAESFPDHEAVDADRIWLATVDYLARHRGGRSLQELVQGQYLFSAAARSFDYAFWMSVLVRTNPSQS
jgi:hypothetical protein